MKLRFPPVALTYKVCLAQLSLAWLKDNYFCCQLLISRRFSGLVEIFDNFVVWKCERPISVHTSLKIFILQLSKILNGMYCNCLYDQGTNYDAKTALQKIQQINSIFSIINSIKGLGCKLSEKLQKQENRAAREWPGPRMRFHLHPYYLSWDGMF